MANPFSMRPPTIPQPVRLHLATTAGPGLGAETASLAAAIRGRYGWQGIGAATPDLVLARPASLIWQPVFRQTRVQIEPRLSLTVWPARRSETLARQAAQRLAWQPAAPLATATTAEPMVVRLLARSLRTEAMPASPAFAAPTAAAPGQSPSAQSTNADRPRARVKPGPEMIVPRATPARPAEEPRAQRRPADRALDDDAPQPGRRPDAGGASMPGAWPARTPEASFDVQRLTDQVMETLDRRLQAAHERLWRG